MKKTLVLLAAIPLAAALAACGTSDQTADGKTSVIASFYPFAYVAQQVGGDLVDVQNLTKPGAEPHDLELKPQQVAAVQEADLVVYEKHFQTAVDEAVEQADRPAGTVVDADRVLTMLPTQAGGEEEEHSDHDHDHGDEDPHTWLDPANMVTMTQAVEKRLSTIDPQHASTYRANADALVARLTKLDADYTAGSRRANGAPSSPATLPSSIWPIAMT
jgi:zinc transport system substrate-binding protein